MSENITITIPDELIERIARRAADLAAEIAEDRWLRGADRIAYTSTRPGPASTPWPLALRRASQSTATAPR